MDPKLGRPRIPRPQVSLSQDDKKPNLIGSEDDREASGSPADQHTHGVGLYITGTNNDGHYLGRRASASSTSSGASSESLRNHNGTPPETSGRKSSSSVSIAKLGRLSLEQQTAKRPRVRKQALRQSVVTPVTTPPGTCVKRNCPSEPTIPIDGQQLLRFDRELDRSATDTAHSPECKRLRSDPIEVSLQQPPVSCHQSRGNPHAQVSKSGPCRPDTYSPPQKRPRSLQPVPTSAPESPLVHSVASEVSSIDSSIPPLSSIGPYSRRYPGLILQPTSSPISKEQLAAEVKGIYSGLVMVEAKCISIDAAQAADPDSQLTADQWQALIALHRTLLYEHHDFLMATQHPSATPALRNLAQKYSMPARMWRHGIHSFLEVLRFRRPQSQDHMLAFIYLAYQMVALLYETVTIFTDTWIECLGDLARYRMAIEENREQHAIWGSVADRWYNTASDRHPEIGRLYHHLGILERPSVRKFYLYTKSLTCTVPFPNAKDSLSTLCTPIVGSPNQYYTGDCSAEAALVTYHALVYSNYGASAIMEAGAEALSRLSHTPATKVKEFGVELVVSHVGALLELGNACNDLWQRFGNLLHKDKEQSRPSADASTSFKASLSETQKQSMTNSTSSAPTFVTGFVYSTFDILIRLGRDRTSVRDILPTVHTILLWIYSIDSLDSRQTRNDDIAQESRGNDLERSHTSSSLPEMFSWGALATFLNVLTQYEPIGSRTLEYARHGMFPLPERREDARPLNEDYRTRGLIWTPGFYPQDWFSTQPNDGSREIENGGTYQARFERVQWLALYLAFRIPPLQFDMEKRVFYATGRKSSMPVKIAQEITPEAKPLVLELEREQQSEPQESIKTTNGLGSTSTPSAHSDEDGYVAVTKKLRSIKGTVRADVAVTTPSKRTVDNTAIQIVGQDDNMEWQPAR